MTIDDWPEWLPADWIIQIRKIDERKVKCFIDPKGQKFYSKPQVDRHLKTSKNSTVSETTNNADIPDLDLSLDPDVLDTPEDPESTPQGHSTRLRRTASSGKKYKETEEVFGGEGSSSVPKSSRGKKKLDTNWLPDGWTAEVKFKKSGQKYKIFTSPNGKKLFSKPQVLSYLANTNSKEGDKTPRKSKITEPTEVEKDETRMITESTPVTPDYEVLSSTPADGLPPGWIKEIRVRTHGSGKKKDPYYLDPLSGYVFFSKLDALRYLDTGDVKKCAMKPSRRDMNQETKIANQTEGEPPEATKEPETPKALQNGSVTESKPEASGPEKRKVRSITGDGHIPMPTPVSSVSSQKGEDWLPEGWIVEMKFRDGGKKLKCYKEVATGHNCYSKPQVLAYLGNGVKTPKSNSGKRKKKRKSYIDSSPDSDSEDFKSHKKSRKTKPDFDTSNFTETIVTTPAEGLPPGWIKEIKTRICGTNIRKDPFYTDPVSGYIFRSKLDALRYLETGDINLCAIRPRMKDADGNEVAIPDARPKPKPRKVPVEVGGSDVEAIDMEKDVDKSDTDPKNTPDSTPGSGSVRRGTRERVAKVKDSPARSSTRIKGKTNTLDENALQSDNGAAAEKGEAGRVNLDKQSGDVEQLDYQLEDDSSWTDQFDFAVKTLVGEFPPNESGGVGNGSPAKAT